VYLDVHNRITPCNLGGIIATFLAVEGKRISLAEVEELLLRYRWF